MSSVNENEEDIKRLRLLDNCRVRTSTSTVSILENLKARINSFRKQKQFEEENHVNNPMKTQEELAILVAHSKTANDEITNNMKIYHRHISKLNRYIDKVMSDKITLHSGIISQVLPPYECNVTPSAMNRILYLARNKS